MKCPLCNLEMRITSTRNVVENDNTPDTPTRLFVVQDLTCVNKQCSNYNTVVETSRTELPLS